MSMMLTDEEILLHLSRLTKEQQEQFAEASVAYRKAKHLVSDLIRDALDAEEEA
jgi:hypothetical protein